MAGARLVGVTELLEKILMDLPCRDLLLSQRVSRQFRRTITGSRLLQQALFLAPAGPVVRWHTLIDHLHPHGWWDYYDYDPNPPLVCWSKTRGDLIEYEVVENPFMEILFPHNAPSGGIPAHVVRGANRPEASCHSIFVSQPPVSLLQVHHKNWSWVTCGIVTPSKYTATAFVPCRIDRRPAPVSIYDECLEKAEGIRMDDLALSTAEVRQAAGSRAKKRTRRNRASVQVDYIWTWLREEGLHLTAASLRWLLLPPNEQTPDWDDELVGLAAMSIQKCMARIGHDGTTRRERIGAWWGHGPVQNTQDRQVWTAAGSHGRVATMMIWESGVDCLWSELGS